MEKSLVFLIVFIAVSVRIPCSEAQSPPPNTTSLSNWKPPKDWHSKFPYYISGFDKEGHPIVVVEYGKWDLMPLMTAGPEKAKLMQNYIEQTMQCVIHLGKSFEDNEGTIFFADFQGFDYSQITHIPTVLFYLRMARYNPELEQAMYKGIVVNMNYAVQVLFDIIAPVVGSSLAKSELLGTNKDRWLAKLSTIIPTSQLPPLYGGSKDWKPLQVLGKGEPIDIELIRRAQQGFLQSNQKSTQ